MEDRPPLGHGLAGSLPPLATSLRSLDLISLSPSQSHILSLFLTLSSPWFLSLSLLTLCGSLGQEEQKKKWRIKKKEEEIERQGREVREVRGKWILIYGDCKLTHQVNKLIA
jgi:hypothetical protein